MAQPIDDQQNEELEGGSTVVVGDALGEKVEAASLASTERLAEIVDRGVELLERTAELVELPEDLLPIRPPTPREVVQRLRDNFEWLDHQLSPVADRFPDLGDALEHLDPTPDEPGSNEGPGEDDDWGPIEWLLFVVGLDWLSRQELTMSFDVDHAAWSFERDPDARFTVWNKRVFTPQDAYAARLGDLMMHGDVVAPGGGSPNVFIGGKPALRSCDSHVCTKATPVPHRGSGFKATYSKITINGFPALRVGDALDEGPHGLNPIVTGCPSVVLGPVAPPFDCWSPSGDLPPPSDIIPFRWDRGRIGHFKGEVVLGVGFDGPFVRVEGTVTAAQLWAEETETTDVLLGDIDGDGIDEALRVRTQATVERALGVADVELEFDPVRRRLEEVDVKPKHVPSRTSDIEVTEEIVEQSA